MCVLLVLLFLRPFNAGEVFCLVTVAYSSVRKCSDARLSLTERAV